MAVTDQPKSIDSPVLVRRYNAATANSGFRHLLLRMRRRKGRGLDSAPTQSLNFFSGLSRASAERLLPRLVAGLATRV